MDRTISIAQLARNAERIANDIETAGTVYRIKRPRGREMVLLDQQYFESWIAAIEFMQRPNWREELAQSDLEMAAGQGRDLEEIVKELGLDKPERKAKRSKAKRSARATKRAKPARRPTKRRGRAQ